MAESKKNQSRQGKVDAFKQKAKEQSKQNKTPKTHLIPLTEWQSTDALELRGDLLEAMEQQFVLTFQSLQEARNILNETQNEFQKAAQVLQMVMQQNIKAGKITLKYAWNNGEDATSEEVATFEKKMNELRELQKKQFEDAQKKENALKTGLVAANGEPIGTTQNLAAGYEGEDEEVVDIDGDGDETGKWDGIADQSRAAAEYTEGETE